MVDLEVIHHRLHKLEECIKKLGVLKQYSWEEFLKDEGIQDRAERNLQVAIQCCIDIGNHLIADLSLKTPEGYGDIFMVLARQGVFPEDFAGELRKMAGFRNILVHDYLEIDPQKLYQVLGKLEDFERFARYILDFMENG